MHVAGMAVCQAPGGDDGGFFGGPSADLFGAPPPPDMTTETVEPTKQGLVRAADTFQCTFGAQPAVDHSDWSIQFQDTTGTSCIDDVVGFGCTRRQCTVGPSGAFADAGTVTIGGGVTTVTAKFMNGAYAGNTLPMGLNWQVNSPVIVAATGATVGAFSATVHMPAAVVFSAPALDGQFRFQAPRTLDLAIAWTVSTGTVAFDLQTTPATGMTDGLRCRFAASAGRANIPAQVLGLLPIGAYVVTAGGVDEQTVAAGSWSVDVAASSNGMLADGTCYNATAIVQ
jgi:hypothetical protein